MAASSSDSALLQRVARGDAGAVREVVDEYGDLVWSLARRFTMSDADAEEAVQDIFVLLWRKADRYDAARGSEATFISVLARRLLIDRWRRERRQPDRDDIAAQAAAADGAHPILEHDELSVAAAQAYADLDEDRQLVLRLSIERGYTHEMIASATGVPLGTVKTRIRSGLGRIRQATEAALGRGGVR
ncbi:MAG: sigma-70 family RNA polymerase sigma factor [Phycisphaerales bacterium]|nr:sigma-70 family RNA polymerase sigma factor [Phycisphaerales bacterium]